MSKIRVEASRVIDARPEAVYAVIADYEVGHAAILPKPYFTRMTVEKGGRGAGTELSIDMNVFGSRMHYRQVVSEPEPGRVIAETDLDRDLETRFFIDPLEGGAKSRVTIRTEFAPSAGFAGLMERLMNPPVMRRIYNKELEQLAEYMRAQKTTQ